MRLSRVQITVAPENIFFCRNGSCVCLCVLVVVVVAVVVVVVVVVIVVVVVKKPLYFSTFFFQTPTPWMGLYHRLTVAPVQ
ncbi:hypothetical protein ElyMa_004973600 [Elysia marginata]|uniref:Transmembrane protein n=1 Tax=Elysia marginata TaxID=1093978 RepID=A0AAV4J5I9_9GAST|nr:hypothetical protein ElyMa_004973600 [Elysia marginata]